MPRRISKSQLNAKLSRAKSQIRQAEAKYRRAQTKLKSDLRRLEHQHRRAQRSLQQLGAAIQAARAGSRVTIYLHEWHTFTATERQQLSHQARTQDIDVQLVDDD